MKIRFLAAFTALLLTLCLLSACGADAPFHAREIAFEPVQSIQNPAPAAKRLPVGDMSRKLVYQYDETSLSGETWEVYQADDGVTAKYCKQNASVSVTTWQGSVIVSTLKSLTGEEAFLAHVQSLARLFVPDVDFSEYEFSCITSYLKRYRDGEEEGWASETENSFYLAQGEDEKVDGYLFTYTQVVDDFATENGITVEMNGKGDLLAFRYECHEADWKFSITDKEIEKTVDAFIKTYEKEHSDRASEVEILGKHLALVDGEVQLCVTVEALFPSNRGWFSHSTLRSFSLYLSPKESE